MLALREHRMHHFFWHLVRDNWLIFDDDTKNSVRDIGWEPPRPSRDTTGAIENNNSGEDFLFMHRQMIIHVNNMLSQIGEPSYPKVEGWQAVPAPGDLDYPVPPVWNTVPDSIRSSKTDEYYNNRMVNWEKDYTNLDILRQLTLGELGSKLEYTIHNAMHRRWASMPIGIRPPTSPDDIDIIWDEPSYDYLADTYSSHVNDIFWKLHGWIDNRIEDWKKAHKITGDVPWSVQWDRNMMPHHNIVHVMNSMSIVEKSSQQNLGEMAKVTKIIAKTKVFPSFEVFDDDLP